MNELSPIENDSPLELGMRGYYQGHHFEIRGVVRLEHEAGGFWDEWYLLFDDGRLGVVGRSPAAVLPHVRCPIETDGRDPFVRGDSPGATIVAPNGRPTHAGCRKRVLPAAGNPRRRFPPR